METPKAKRQKVVVACGPCRSRKVKCDGSEPVCGPCRKRSEGAALCTWSSNPRPHQHAPIPADSVAWLAARIEQLERRTVAHQRRGQGEPGSAEEETEDASFRDAPGDSQHSLPGRSAASMKSTASSPIASRAETSTSAPNSFPYAPVAPPSSSHAMSNSALQPRQQHTHTSPSNADTAAVPSPVHAVIGANPDDQGRGGFFGISSAGTFMQSVRLMVEQRMDHSIHPDQRAPPQGREHQPPLYPPDAVDEADVNHVLPLRKTADALIGLYWEYVHVLYPFLDAAQTQEEYERLWEANLSTPSRKSFLCLVNIIFALSTQIDPSIPPEKREGAAAAFYVRATALVDFLETGSVRTVQLCLLLGMYCQSISNADPCWTFVGHAIRIAQSVGLHLPETSERAPDAPTRELLRRVWHGCVLMDRLLSMTYGRPCGIGVRTARAIPLPAPLETDHHHLPSFDSQQQQMRPASERQPHPPSIIDSYTTTLRLYELLHDIIYAHNSPGVQQAQSIDDLYEFFFEHSIPDPAQVSILDLERKLNQWEKSIPEHLQFARAQPPGADERGPSALFYRQAVVLHQQHLHVRLLLLRPFLSPFITSEYDSSSTTTATTANPSSSTSSAIPLSRRIFLQSAIVCVQIAQEAIKVVHAQRAADVRDVGPLSAWWYNILFLYTSATALIAARLSPSILAELCEEALLESWREALEVLEAYGAMGPSIQRLVTTLRVLFEAVPMQYYFRRWPALQQSHHLADNNGGAADLSTLYDTNLSAPGYVPLGGNGGGWYSTTGTPTGNSNAVGCTSSSPPLHDMTRLQFASAAEAGNPGGEFLPGDMGAFRGFGGTSVFDPSHVEWLTSLPLDI